MCGAHFGPAAANGFFCLPMGMSEVNACHPRLAQERSEKVELEGPGTPQRRPVLKRRRVHLNYYNQ